jgi:DNA-binding response OmpR family regulator
MKMQVLVIEDHDGVAEVIEKVLLHDGHRVLRARDGQEGVSVFRRHHFDLVITDVVMPVQDGLETIRELLAQKPGLRVIAMSGGGQWCGLDFLSEARDRGAIATLEKPFRPRELLELLRQIEQKTAPVS